jgi:hypothetical protein
LPHIRLLAIDRAGTISFKLRPTSSVRMAAFDEAVPKPVALPAPHQPWTSRDVVTIVDRKSAAPGGYHAARR